MRRLGLAFGLLVLSFSVACGGGSSSSGGGPTPQGNFSNASLSGQYTYQLRGSDYSGASTVEFREMGSFVADGAGHITSGQDDLVEISFGGTTSFTSSTGTYAIRNDGIGVANLTLSGGSVLTLAITMIDSTRAQITEYDSLATGVGSLVKQDTNAISAVPSGTFAFRLHNIGGFFASTSNSSVGVMTLANGVGTGTDDALRSGALNTHSLSASFNVPDAFGSGTGTITDTITNSFVYYIVDANTVHILVTTPGLIGMGTAQLQTGGPFSTVSINGNYIVGLRGDTSSLRTEGSLAVGRFTADGNGNITAGTLDEDADGVVTATDTPLTAGLYTVASNGRGTMTLNSSLGTRSEVFYMVTAGSAYTLTNDPSVVEDGSFTTQQAGSYSNSSLNGQYAFATHGFTTSPDLNDRVGTLIADGSGHVTIVYLLNTFSNGPNVDGSGNAATISFTGTYSVGSDGRVMVTILSVSNNFVFYLRSTTDGDILQADTGVEISGNLSKQQ